MTEDLTTLELDQFYPHPPAKVWRALTEPDLMARWLMPTTDFEPVVGNRFRMQGRPIEAVDFSGEIVCEILELVEAKRLRISWDDANADRPTGWVITWDLRPEGTGTRILFSHTGFDPDNTSAQLSRTIMGGGWKGIIARLGEVVDAV